MSKFRFYRYDKENNCVVATNVPPNPDGSDKDEYMKPTGLKDKNNKDILDGDSVKNICNDTSGTVIANMKIKEEQGDVKIKNIVIDDNNNVIIIDKNNCLLYEK
jgi:hypothetical protein